MVSVSTAIELTKIMKEKLLTKEVCSDLQKILIFNKKIFTRKEPINLGITSVLHDIHLAQKMPKLCKTTKLGFREESKFEKHPAKAYHFLKASFREIDFDVKRTVYQHHEYIDGSGFPNGLNVRLFSRYSLILSFSVHYVIRITENYFHPLKHPYIVLQEMLSVLRPKFDSNVLLTYIKVASLYLIVCWVLLNTGQIAVVCKSHLEKPNRPIINILLNSKFEPFILKLLDTEVSSVQRKAPLPFLEGREEGS